MLLRYAQKGGLNKGMHTHPEIFFPMTSDVLLVPWRDVYCARQHTGTKYTHTKIIFPQDSPIDVQNFVCMP